MIKYLSPPPLPRMQQEVSCVEELLRDLYRHQGPVSHKILSPLVILSKEKTMAAMMISELKSILKLRFSQKMVPGSSKKARQGPMK